MQFNYALNQIEWERVRGGEIQLKFICSKSAGVERHDSRCRRELCVSQKSTVSGICETTWDIKLLLLWLLRFASFSAYEVWLEFEENARRRKERCDEKAKYIKYRQSNRSSWSSEGELMSYRSCGVSVEAINSTRNQISPHLMGFLDTNRQISEILLFCLT